MPRALVARAMVRSTLRRIERLVEPPLTFALAVPEDIIVAPPDILAGEGGQAEDIYGGRFELAGHAVETGGASPFAFTDAPGPWLRALHGFGWLRHASVRGDALAPRPRPRAGRRLVPRARPPGSRRGLGAGRGRRQAAPLAELLARPALARGGAASARRRRAR